VDDTSINPIAAAAASLDVLAIADCRRRELRIGMSVDIRKPALRAFK
jgi:hypothetical protein